MPNNFNYATMENETQTWGDRLASMVSCLMQLEREIGQLFPYAYTYT